MSLGGRLLQSVSRIFSGRVSGPGAVRYARRPGAVSLGDWLYAPNAQRASVVNEVGLSIWNALQTPRTMDELVSALTAQYAVDRATAEADIGSFLEEMSGKELVVRLAEGDQAPVPASESRTEALLAAAFERQKAGEWYEAKRLCLEVGPDEEHSEIVLLNIYICNYNLGALDGLAGKAMKLAPRLPMLARLECWGLAMASAWKEGDLPMVKTVACEASRHVDNPWDVPTLPKFFLFKGDKLAANSSASVDVFIEMLVAVQAQGVHAPEEMRLLKSLEQHYRDWKQKARIERMPPDGM